jgi:cell shape-determining protein MreC
MRKTYSLRRNALLSSGGLSLGAVALALALLCALARFAVPGVFAGATAPLLGAGAYVSGATDTFLSSFRNAADVSAQNRELMSQIQSLSVENRTLTDKVASLSALLGDSSKPASAPGIIASVVARPPESPYDALTLGKGSADGVKIGMEAFGDSGVPIGTITWVGSGFSRLTLFSAPGASLSAWASTAHVPVTLSGAGAGAFTASVPRASGLVEGDAVYAPGSDALPVGTIRRIGGAAASPQETLYIAPAANPFTLAYVVVRESAPALAGALSWATSTAP